MTGQVDVLYLVVEIGCRKPAQQFGKQDRRDDVLGLISEKEQGGSENGSISHAQTTIDQLAGEAHAEQHDGLVGVQTPVNRSGNDEGRDNCGEPDYAPPFVADVHAPTVGCGGGQSGRREPSGSSWPWTTRPS